jgi:hypothetical protein
MVATEPRYSVGTWDTDAQGFTPQVGCEPWYNLTLGQQRAALRRLRSCGYSAHRYSTPMEHGYDSDMSVLVERTDGMSESEVLESWER